MKSVIVIDDHKHNNSLDAAGVDGREKQVMILDNKADESDDKFTEAS